MAVVLTAAATPVHVPTAPCARLNLPVPVVRSVMTKTVMTVIMAPLMPSRIWTAIIEYQLAPKANRTPRSGSKPKRTSNIGLRPHCSA